MGPQLGTLATSPLPSRRSPTVQSGDKLSTSAKSGRIGHMTLAVWGVPNASAGDKIKLGPTTRQIGYITPAVRGIPNALERETNLEVGQQSGQIGYITPSV